MGVISAVLSVIPCLAILSCSSSPLYPAAAMKPLELNAPFNPITVAPEAYKGQLIHLAGRIVEVKRSTGEEGGTLIEAQRMWLDHHPEYPGFRPVEFGEEPLDMFLLWYPGRPDPEAMRVGNKFVAVTRIVTSPKAKQMKLLLFRAHCLHVWKTGAKKIEFFKDRYTQVYAPLEQETYCTEDSAAALAQAADATKAAAQAPAQPSPPVPAEEISPPPVARSVPPSAAAPAPMAPQPPVPRFGKGQQVQPLRVVVLTADAAGTKRGPTVGPKTQLTVVEGVLQGTGWVYLVARPKTSVRGWISESQLAPVHK